MRIMCVVNGYPRAGKDTAVEFMTREANRLGYVVDVMSTIDGVREMLAKYGIDTRRKTPEDRKLLASMGELLEEHSGFRTKSALGRFIGSEPDTILFVHLREPALIQKLEDRVQKMPGAFFTTVYVERHEAAQQAFSNASDAAASQDGYGYDTIIPNNGTLGQLYDACAEAMKWIRRNAEAKTRRTDAKTAEAL